MLQGRRILLAVTGSIAAYKSAYLTRELVKAGAEVKVLLTDGAEHFVRPLTFSTLSKNPVLSTSIRDEGTGGWTDHVGWGRWPDLILIAPATANSMARLANGLADDLLGLIYLSAECPVHFAPAMDLEMYRHPTTRSNIERLEGVGCVTIPAQEGELASGLEGVGRMEEPDQILQHLEETFRKQNSWKGKKVLVTAGPTYEAIDPVRFIGNRSSGKMGVALAEAAAARGAEVTLISGPGSVQARNPAIHTQRVESAKEMHDAANASFSEMDLAIMAAAVSDHRPSRSASEKIKKAEKGELKVELEPTEDILASLGEKKKNGQYLVGFALETNEGGDEAQRKLESKNADLIVLNSLQDEGAGFEHDTNQVTLHSRNNDPEQIPLDLKSRVAERILDRVEADLS